MICLLVSSYHQKLVRWSEFRVPSSSSQKLNMEFSKLVSTQEIAQHNTPEDLWIVVGDEVWDVTNFSPEHPGGLPCEWLQSFELVMTSVDRQMQ